MRSKVIPTVVAVLVVPEKLVSLSVSSMLKKQAKFVRSKKSLANNLPKLLYLLVLMFVKNNYSHSFIKYKM
ncbi:hypothetical protein D9M68_638880 [compost metagenome]